MVAPATHILFVLWLLVASTYWKLSYGVSVHTHLECIPQCHYKQRSKTPTLLCELNVLHCSYKLNKTNNVYFCFKNKYIHYERHKKKNHSKIHNLYSYFSSKPSNTHENYSTSTTNNHLGPPIKWWEDVGYGDKMSNDLSKTIHKHVNIFSSQPYAKNSIHALYMFKNMAETSTTRNMDVCVVAENGITNSSQKRTSTALVTITQKNVKNKKILGVKGLSLWLGFQALNHINKQKDLPLEYLETTKELMDEKRNRFR